jgi:hypothetical protein
MLSYLQTVQQGDTGMARKKRPFAGPLQQAMIADLKRRFGEIGHLIVPVSTLRRDHAYDFLAVPKDNPHQFLIVQPRHRGRVRVRPFCCETLYVKEKKVVAQARKAHSRKIVWYGQIPLQELKLGLQHYVTPQGVKEIKRIIGLKL